jgi:Acetyltransferase (GNAT) domain
VESLGVDRPGVNRPGEEGSSTTRICETLSSQRCFDEKQFSAYFLSPAQFAPLAAWVGSIRASTYRQISPLGPRELDLDGRDANYWHLLILDREQQCLAGSLRMSLSRWHGVDWDGSHSYLEHCYPGLDASLRGRGMAYAEIGRTFVAGPYQRTSPVLRMLLRAMTSIPLATGHDQLLGMVSYNHLQHSERLHGRFLRGLQQPPIASTVALPQPRHPFPLPAPEGVEAPERGADPGPDPAIAHLQALERHLRDSSPEAFRAPLLLKKYMSFGNARVAGLSLARDFNQICEILMLSDLNQLKPLQRRELMVNALVPVWQQQAEPSAVSR